MGALVDDLFDLACIDSGAVSLEYDVVDLEGLVSELRSPLRCRGPSPENPPVVPTGEAASTRSRCAPDKVERVLTNLLTNALRYTPSGGSVAVTVAGGAGAVFVSVEDTGIGIAPEVADRVFEPFWRADGARTSTGGGAGLGLAIARGLIEAQGGRIWAEPPPGGGDPNEFRPPRLSRRGRPPGGSEHDPVARAYFAQDAIFRAGHAPETSVQAAARTPRGQIPPPVFDRTERRGSGSPLVPEPCR